MSRHLASCSLALGSLVCASAAQESRAVFDAPLVAVPGDNRIEYLIDFDLDGYMDALSWWYTSNAYQTIQVRGWRNDHTGALSLAWQTTFPIGGQLPVRVAIGEIDGDGNVDFMVAYAGLARIYTSNGLAVPTLHETLTEPENIKDCALRDVDGDGYAEVIHRLPSGTLKVYRNQGPANGCLHVQSCSSSLAAPISELRLGELTGDGVLDVVFVYSNHVLVVPLDASGACQTPIQYPTVSTWFGPRPAIGDVDGDGDDDLIVWDGQGANGFYELFRRSGPGALALEAPHAGGPSTELADIDLDGDLDGICCGGGTGTPNWKNAGSSTFNVCHNDGTGTFTPAFQMRGVGSSHIAGAADMDHDGDVDLVAGRVIYFARGTFASSPVSVLGGALVSEHTAVDFDGDGDRDLNFGLSGVQRSNGQSQYAGFAPMFPPAPAGAQFQGPGYPGDFDGDGDLDWIVARADAGAFTCMELLVDLGGGHFADGGPAGAPGVDFTYLSTEYLASRGALVADLDVDGDLDLLTRPLFPYPSANSSRTWLNDGTGFFTQGTTEFGVAVALADLNGDLVPDFIGRTTASDSVLHWRLGLGNGAFEFNGHGFPGPYFELDSQDQRIAVEDLDADGDVDVAAINASTNFNGSLYLWRNNGAGSFTVEYPSVSTQVDYSDPLHVVAGDVDGDGWSDLVGWPAYDAYAGAWILLRTSNGTGFQAPFLQAVQPTLLDDIDSDGDDDAIGRGPGIGVNNAITMSRTIDGPSVGERCQFGQGSLGAGGCVPVLGATGPFRVGEVMQLRVRGGLGNANGYIAVGVTETLIHDTPFPGMTSYIATPHRKLPLKLEGSPGQPCVGWRTRQFVVPPGFAGHTWFHQVFLFDAGAPNGLSSTNALKIAYD